MPFTFITEDGKENKISNEQPQNQNVIDNLISQGKEALRPVARTASTLAGVATGLPGSVLSLAHKGAGKITEAAGLGSQPYEETQVSKFLPTIDQATETIRSISPEYLKPKNETEKFVDDVIADTALLFSPAKTKIPFANTANTASKLLKPLYVSLGANITGKGVESVTGSDSKGGYAKTGAMLLLSLFSPGAAARYASGLYKEAEAALPKGTTLDGTQLAARSTKLKDKVLAGRSKDALAPSEKFVVDEADNILSLIKDGKAPVESVQAQGRSLVEKLNEFLFKSPDKKSQARARKLATELQHAIGDSLNDYGKKNPKFGENFSKAQKAFSTISKSNFISRAVEKFKYTPVTAGLLHLFGAPVGKALSGALIPYSAVKLGYRIAKDPNLARFYAKSVQAALENNATAFVKETSKLDKALQENSSKNPQDKITFVAD